VINSPVSSFHTYGVLVSLSKCWVHPVAPTNAPASPALLLLEGGSAATRMPCERRLRKRHMPVLEVWLLSPVGTLETGFEMPFLVGEVGCCC